MLALIFFDGDCSNLPRRWFKRALVVRDKGACEGLCSLGVVALDWVRLSTRGRASSSSLDIETALPGVFPFAADIIILRPGVLTLEISRDEKGVPILVSILVRGVIVGVISVRRRFAIGLAGLGVAPAWNDWVMRSSPVVMCNEEESRCEVKVIYELL